MDVFSLEKGKQSFAWEESFPPVFGHTSVAFLKRCPGYEAAKNGDMDAALAVVSLCVKADRLARLRQRYPKALLLPVASRNLLPEALAVFIGLKLHRGVYLIHETSRKGLSAMERLLHRPTFGGRIIKGRYYILVDDVVTQGGTVSALRKYVIIQGGMIAAIAALACAIGGGIVASEPADFFLLADRLGYSKIIGLLRRYRVADDLQELTRSQVKYLLRFKSISRLSRKMAACTEAEELRRA